MVYWGIPFQKAGLSLRRNIFWVNNHPNDRYENKGRLSKIFGAIAGGSYADLQDDTAQKGSIHNGEGAFSSFQWLSLFVWLRWTGIYPSCPGLGAYIFLFLIWVKQGNLWRVDEEMEYTDIDIDIEGRGREGQRQGRRERQIQRRHMLGG